MQQDFGRLGGNSRIVRLKVRGIIHRADAALLLAVNHSRRPMTALGLIGTDDILRTLKQRYYFPGLPRSLSYKPKGNVLWTIRLKRPSKLIHAGK